MALWNLNLSAPSSLDQLFDVSASEQSWGWFGLPVPAIGSEFELPAVPWVFDFSILSDFYVWTVESVAAGLPQRPITITQAVQRAASW